MSAVPLKCSKREIGYRALLNPHDKFVRGKFLVKNFLRFTA
jgi:hypothetical protein